MAGSTDLNLLRAEAHSPSYFSLLRESSGLQGAPVDFCIPCNPYFPTPEVFELLGKNITTILKYYPSDTDTIAAELSSVLGLKAQTVVMGNGSTELITWIDHLLVRDSLAIPIPTFGRWTDQPLETGKRVDMYQLPESQGFALDVDSYVQFIRGRGSRVAVICNPNNPDGGFLPATGSSSCSTNCRTSTSSWWTSRSSTSSTPSRTRAWPTRPRSGPT